MDGRKQRAVSFENKKRVFRDGNHVVEIHDIGPYTHARVELA